MLLWKLVSCILYHLNLYTTHLLGERAHAAVWHTNHKNFHLTFMSCSALTHKLRWDCPVYEQAQQSSITTLGIYGGRYAMGRILIVVIHELLCLLMNDRGEYNSTSSTAIKLACFNN